MFHKMNNQIEQSNIDKCIKCGGEMSNRPIYNSIRDRLVIYCTICGYAKCLLPNDHPSKKNNMTTHDKFFFNGD